MCGISGIFLKKQTDLNIAAEIQVMNNEIAHRGPDDEGYVMFSPEGIYPCYGTQTRKQSIHSDFYHAPKYPVYSNVSAYLALAHRMLTIVSFAPVAHQPMCSSDKNIWITFNGEIYNFRELRKELSSFGFQFISDTDTEVIIYAYQHWGFDCLKRFEGMWAFVIFDHRSGTFFASRDRFGVKPFYYYSDEAVFAFASESKAIEKLSFFEKKVNHRAVFDYLAMKKIEQHEEGMLLNIFELPPAHFLTFNIHSFHISSVKYYDLEVNNRFSSHRSQEFPLQLQKIEDSLYDSILKRMPELVKPGFCVSGGIDSSVIASISNEYLLGKGQQIETFTARNNFKHSDESHWAALVNQQLHAKQNFVHCTSQEMMEQLGNIIYFQDSPLLSSSTYAQFAVMQKASQNNCKVMFDGQGGDEAFAGYETFFFSHLFSILKKGHLKSFCNEFSSLSNSPVSAGLMMLFLLKYLLNKSFAGNKPKWITLLLKNEFTYLNKSFFNEFASKHQFTAEVRGENVNKLSKHYMTGYFLKNLLRWADRCGMASSVEIRSPFADDHKLVELALSIPPDLKINKGWSKFFLREILKNNGLDFVAKRKDKMGFSTPMYAWMAEQRNVILENIIQNRFIDSYVDKKKIIRDFDDIFRLNKRKELDLIWMSLNLSIWASSKGIQ